MAKRNKRDKFCFRTAEAWERLADTIELLIRLPGRFSRPRLRRLFAVACCRQRWNRIADRDNLRQSFKDIPAAIDVAERYADGLATNQERVSAGNSLRRGSRLIGFPDTTGALLAAAAICCVGDSWTSGDRHEGKLDIACMVELEDDIDESDAFNDEAATIHRALVRDIFGNPFAMVQFDPRWACKEAVNVARSIYEGRRFEDLPILADAVEEAGCTDESVLSHCRKPGLHTSGCWVLDFVLGWRKPEAPWKRRSR